MWSLEIVRKYLFLICVPYDKYIIGYFLIIDRLHGIQVMWGILMIHIVLYWPKTVIQTVFHFNIVLYYLNKVTNNFEFLLYWVYSSGC